MDWDGGRKVSLEYPVAYVVCNYQSPRTPDAATIVSILVILSSFVTRVIRLHKVTSGFASRIRNLGGSLIKSIIKKAEAWSSPSHEQGHGSRVRRALLKGSSTLSRTLLYQPSCALLFTFRTIIDMYTSIFWEVSAFGSF